VWSFSCTNGQFVDTNSVESLLSMTRQQAVYSVESAKHDKATGSLQCGVC
jgi:hypothetical protein